jgi:transcriptional regulator with XRE-family HTH domain
MSNSVTELIKKLEAKQGELTDGTFARQLGISRSMWIQMRQGTRKPGLPILSKIANVFPDLQLLIMQCVVEDGQSPRTNPCPKQEQDKGGN